jgi:hypothetical protein
MKLINRIQKNYLLISLVLLLTAIILLSSCNTGELSRSEAQSQIEQSKEFKSISTLSLETYTEKKGEGNSVSKISISETKEDAMKRNLEKLLYENADIAVVKHLGYVDIKQEFIKFDPNFYGKGGQFYISLTTRTSAKGRILWEKANVPEELQINQEEKLPLALKEFSEVPGTTKQGENTAIVNFTYKWNPTELGEVFDSGSKQFKSLPADLQNNLQGKHELYYKDKTIS